jgi:hypothetical protein
MKTFRVWKHYESTEYADIVAANEKEALLESEKMDELDFVMIMEKHETNISLMDSSSTSATEIKPTE